VLAAKLRETSGSKRQNVMTRRDSSTSIWPNSLYDPEADSYQLLEEAEEKARLEMMEKDEQPNFIPLDVAI